MIEFEINDKKVQAPEGSMIIEAADTAGVYIPRFCYHKKLSIAANCRMCLVEIEGGRKPMPACATPISSGMKVYTQSKMALDAQRAVMEFLLINHPLDCPICDQGGECELQDLSMGFGKGASRYTEGKRSVHDKDIGPLIKTEMTRCIHCTRCVRFGDEIAGMRELGGTGRGEHTEIGTYIAKQLKSELSGNVIDICPVGALTSKPFAFRARAWEMEQHESIALHDCVGSNIYVHTRSRQYSGRPNVLRVVPRDNEAINENWISDRDRFAYEGLNSEERVTKPMIKDKGKWRETDWQTALNVVADRMLKNGLDQAGALISSNATLEEQTLLHKLFPNVDHRLRYIDFSQDLITEPLNLAELEQQHAILLIGSYVRHEQPMICHRIRKASLNDCNVMVVNPVDYAFNFTVTEKEIVANDAVPQVLADIANSSGAIAEQLSQAEKACILLGSQAVHHPNAAEIFALANQISEKTGATVHMLPDGANGLVPSKGMNAKQMIEQPLKSYVLFNAEPEFDCAFAKETLSALDSADFVVSLSTFKSNAMNEYADVILPIAPFTETSGTYINVEHKHQSFCAVTKPYADVRPGWKVLRVLGNLFSLDGFDYESSVEVLDGAVELNVKKVLMPAELSKPSGKLQRIGDWPMYRIDALVRRSEPLQQCLEEAAIRLHSTTAKSLNIGDGDVVTAKQDGSQIRLPVKIDDTIAENNVFIFAGLEKTAGFGAAYGEVEIDK